MKEDNHDIDNYFNKGMEGLEVVPPAFVWENVQAAIQPKKRRRIVFFWMLALAGTGIIGFVIGRQTEPLSLIQKSATETASKSLENIQLQNDDERIDNKVVSKEIDAIQVFAKDHNSQTSPNKTFHFNLKNRKTVIESDENMVVFEENSPKKPIQSAVEASEINNRNISNLALLPLLSLKGLVWNTNFPLSKKSSDCYNFSPKNWSSSLEGYIGYDYMQPFFKNKGNEKSNYAALRDSSETYKIGGDAGIWLSSVHHSGLGLRGGLHVSRWVENLKVVNSYEERFQISITQVKDPKGNVIRLDTAFNLVRGRYLKQLYNQYTSLNLPLQLGFEFNKNENWQFFVFGGALLNLRFWSNGDVFASDANTLVSFPEKNQLFRTRTNMSLLGHLGVRRKIAEHWYLSGSIQANYLMGDITRIESPLSQRYLSIGTQLGLRYQF
ncbi:MAG: hypothetical protein ACOYOA_13320 [Saprospiraceae bacterium]